MVDEERFVKIGIFRVGGLDFDRPPILRPLQREEEKIFKDALQKVNFVESISEEYARLSIIRCSCGGVF